MSQGLGRKIKQTRKLLKISLRELARKSTLSASFISDIEKGKRYPSVDSLKAIAKVLNTNYRALKKHDLRGICPKCGEKVL